MYMHIKLVTPSNRKGGFPVQPSIHISAHSGLRPWEHASLSYAASELGHVLHRVYLRLNAFFCVGVGVRVGVGVGHWRTDEDDVRTRANRSPQPVFTF